MSWVRAPVWPISFSFQDQFCLYTLYMYCRYQTLIVSLMMQIMWSYFIGVRISDVATVSKQTDAISPSLGPFPMGVFPSGLFPTDSSPGKFSQLRHFPSGVIPMVIFTNRTLPNQEYSQWTFSQYQKMKVNCWTTIDGNGIISHVALCEGQSISFEIYVYWEPVNPWSGW